MPRHYASITTLLVNASEDRETLASVAVAAAALGSDRCGRLLLLRRRGRRIAAVIAVVAACAGRRVAGRRAARPLRRGLGGRQLRRVHRVEVVRLLDILGG